MRDIEIPNCKNFRRILSEIKITVSDFSVPDISSDNFAMWANKRDKIEERINSLEGLVIKFIVLRKFLEKINAFPEETGTGNITTVDSCLKNECVVFPNKRKGTRITINRDLTINTSGQIDIPENLTVYGYFEFIAKGQESLPKGLNIDGNLDIFMTSLDSLPDDLRVGGVLIMNDKTQNHSPIMVQAAALKRKGQISGIRVE